MKNFHEKLGFLVFLAFVLFTIVYFFFRHNPTIYFSALGYIAGLVTVIFVAVYLYSKQTFAKETEMSISQNLQTALDNLKSAYAAQQHAAVTQVQTQLDAANTTIAQLQAQINAAPAPVDTSGLQAQIDAANTTIAQLQANLNSADAEDVAAVVAATPVVS